MKNPFKQRRKRQLLLKHREERYLHAIGKVIEGRADPDYATLRWEKLKEVRGK